MIFLKLSKMGKNNLGRVLVTGGAGYIGSHTVAELYQNGYEVVVADDLSNSSIEVLKALRQITGVEIPFERVDCSIESEMHSVFSKYPDIRYAIHFAAFKAVEESVEKPLDYYRNNLNSLINVIDELKGKEGAGIVFSSSCTVYGEPDSDNLPVSESAPIKPSLSPYGKSKQMAEEILRDSVKAFPSLKVISLRYFNPIGAHPSGLIGELPLGAPQNLMPVITQTAIGIRESMSVFGTDYNTPDGSCIRDYIYVCDLAKAHILALKKLDTSSNFDVYNLGTGKGVSVLEMIYKFEKISGVKLNYNIKRRREGDVEQLWADPSKAQRELNWVADTPLNKVILSAWEWERRVRGKSS